MARDLDRDQVRAWMARWEEVGRRTTDEIRALTPKEKFRQLEVLMASAGLFERPASSPEDDQRVRELWMRLHALG